LRKARREERRNPLVDAVLAAIGSVTGPLTLVAFLAAVVLAVFRRSVDDEKGLEYAYKLGRRSS
jgi:hypothetical protein